MGLLCRAEDYLSNLSCAALRAMTDPVWVCADMLFMMFMQLMKVCGAIHDFDRFPKALPLG
jgi:hypothetical protein